MSSSLRPLSRPLSLEAAMQGCCRAVEAMDGSDGEARSGAAGAARAAGAGAAGGAGSAGGARAVQRPLALRREPARTR